MSDVGYKKPPVGKRFVKGKSGNPSGVSKLTADIMEARKVSKQTFEEKLQTFLRTPMVDIEEMLDRYKDTKAFSLDLMVASIIKHAVINGCITRMNFILNRMGVNAQFQEHDPTLDVTPQAQQVEAAPFFVVEVSSGGKFTRARPREMLPEERVAQMANG